MIRSLSLAGKVLLDTGADFLGSLVQEVNIPGRKTQHIVYLDVKLHPPGLEMSFEELDTRRTQDVLWVGNASAMDPQDRFTSSNVGYLISQTIPNLLKPGRLPDGNLREMLEKFARICYLDPGVREEVLEPGASDPQYDRYRTVWNLPLLGIDSPELLPARDRQAIEPLLMQFDVEPGQDEPLPSELPLLLPVSVTSQPTIGFLSRDFLRTFMRAQGKSKLVVSLLEKVLHGWIEAQSQLKKRDIALYTLRLDGELLAQHPDYRAYLTQRFVEESFSEAKQGVCHVCGENTDVTTNTKRFALQKYYNTDKLNFASGLDDKEGFERAYRLCQSCYQSLLVGERFALNQLRTRLAGTQVFVIPSFHLPILLTGAKLEHWAEYLQQRVSATRTLQAWHAFQKQLERFQGVENQKAAFLIHFLFVRKAQSEVRILKLVADVSPSRLDEIDRVREQTRLTAEQKLGENRAWDLGLDRLFYLFPIRKRGNDPQSQVFLDFLDALLTARKLRFEWLVPLLLETACVHRFERYCAYVHQRPHDADYTLMLYLIQSQLLLHYLDRLGILIRTKGDELMEMEQQVLPQELQAQLVDLELTEPQRALYLLGYLVGQVANAQYHAGRSKPVLDKIQFQGMDATKVVRLANEIYDKLRQYKVVQYNEGVFAVMHALLDRERSRLKSPQENTYWVLSGYAFATYQAIRGHDSQGKKDNSEKLDASEQSLMEELQ